MQAMQAMQVYGYSYREGPDILPALVFGIVDSGGWVLEQNEVSAFAIELKFETELFNAVDLYAALQNAGLMLTRTGHLALTEMCTCRKYLPERDHGRVVTILLKIGLMQEEASQFCHYARPSAA